jgi:hypothetical protein
MPSNQKGPCFRLISGYYSLFRDKFIPGVPIKKAECRRKNAERLARSTQVVDFPHLEHAILNFHGMGWNASLHRRGGLWHRNGAHGWIAQSVEQRTENPCVAGSIPAPATTFSIVLTEEGIPSRFGIKIAQMPANSRGNAPRSKGRSGLAVVARLGLARRFDLALGGPVTRPREEDHGKHDGDQKRFTVMHDKNR